MNAYSYETILSNRTIEVDEETLREASTFVVKAICKTLPEKAHRIDVIKHVLRICEDELNTMKVSF